MNSNLRMMILGIYMAKDIVSAQYSTRSVMRVFLFAHHINEMVGDFRPYNWRNKIKISPISQPKAQGDE